MRVIDADAIPYITPLRETMAYKEDIDKMPTIDVVEVVRCKDCRHYHVETYRPYSEDYPFRWCDFLNIKGKIPPDTEPMDFCSYGERKETDHE